MALVGCITSNRGDFQSPGTLEGSNAMSTTVKSPIFKGPVPGVFLLATASQTLLGMSKNLWVWRKTTSPCVLVILMDQALLKHREGDAVYMTMCEGFFFKAWTRLPVVVVGGRRLLLVVVVGGGGGRRYHQTSVQQPVVIHFQGEFCTNWP